MVDYEVAIKKPFTDLTKLIIGIILSIIPIMNWIAKGFIIECSGLGKNKPSKKMPEWKNWGYLFIKGLASDIIFLIYLIPAFLAFLMGAGFAISSIASAFMGMVPPEYIDETSPGPRVMRDIIQQNWIVAAPRLVALAPMLLTGLILALIALYLTPMAVMNYLKKKRFSAAFNLGLVIKKTLTIKYFVAWLVIIILTMIIAAILTAILWFIPGFGALIAMFIMGVFSYSLYGQVYKET